MMTDHVAMLREAAPPPEGVQLVLQRGVTAQNIDGLLGRLYELNGCISCGLVGIDVRLRLDGDPLSQTRALTGVREVTVSRADPDPHPWRGLLLGAAVVASLVSLGLDLLSQSALRTNEASGPAVSSALLALGLVAAATAISGLRSDPNPEPWRTILLGGAALAGLAGFVLAVSPTLTTSLAKTTSLDLPGVLLAVGALGAAGGAWVVRRSLASDPSPEPWVPGLLGVAALVSVASLVFALAPGLRGSSTAATTVLPKALLDLAVLGVATAGLLTHAKVSQAAAPQHVEALFKDGVTAPQIHDTLGRIYGLIGCTGCGLVGFDVRLRLPDPAFFPQFEGMPGFQDVTRTGPAAMAG